MRTRALFFAVCLGWLPALSLPAADLTTPVPMSITVSNGTKTVRWPLIPALDGWRFTVGSNVTNISGVSNAGVVRSFSGYSFALSNSLPAQYYSLQLTQMNSNAVLTANVLNRLAYGPTPDELERVTAIGPQAYIDEQLNFQGVPETLDEYTLVYTNGVNGGQGIPNTNWATATVTGRYSGQLMYIYMTTPGEVYVDNLQLRPMYFTNEVSMVGTNMVTNSVAYYGSNLVSNGDFEAPLAGTWTISTNLAGSAIVTDPQHVCGGAGSLHVLSLSPGTTQGSSIWQNNLVLGVTNNQPVQLSYRYLQGPGTDRLKIRLTGNGVVSSADDLPPAPGWIYATATGPLSSANMNLYIYLSGAGECHIDDLKLVAGSVPEAGANLLLNPDFESALTGPWQFTENFTNSYIDNTVSHSGNGSLKLVATAAGAGNGNAAFQSVGALVNNATYSVSFWYQPPTRGRQLTVRLSGSLLLASPDTTLGSINRRLNTPAGAGISDLRAWFSRHAVEANRQLLEVLCQFWENHFVTQYSKSVDYLNVFTQDGGLQDRYATDWEYREQTKWRNAMLNPQCTFYDLLKVSAESPAMIVYLDTVNSKGNGNNVANENYARELLELFCNGVDNGYDQTDIISMSRAWTGWSVELVDPENLNNPFAAQSQTFVAGVSSTALSNTVGVLAFNYKSGNHGTNRAHIFAGKTVPARFGFPWAGRSYDLNIPARATGTTNGIQDGYDVIRHLANLPFTEEYLSVKLCRLFVHDDFPNPTTRTDLTNDYAFYDYTDPNRSAEAELVHQCMLAWENGNPKGQIRDVLRVIFSSDLFRTSLASAQKVKTPLEYVASSVRALRSVSTNGTATAGTDGYSFSTRLSRMGAMDLFNRAEPNGYPEAGPPWISAGTLAERIRYIQALCGSGVGDDAGNNVCDPVALLKKKLASGNWNNAGAVADYFLGILYPGEGKANLDQYRTAAISFLNTADDGVTASLFTGQNNTGATYDTRVRGMVSMLMTLQRFQEQ